MQVLLLIHRLETFQCAYGEERFDSNTWSTFSQGDFLKEAVSNLMKGKIAAAIIIWKRHQHEFVYDITLDILQDILHAIPEEASASSLQVYVFKNSVTDC